MEGVNCTGNGNVEKRRLLSPQQICCAPDLYVLNRYTTAFPAPGITCLNTLYRHVDLTSRNAAVGPGTPAR